MFNITGVGLGLVGFSCPRFVDVCLCGCDVISEAGAFSLAQLCPRHRKLVLYDTQITYVGEARLRAAYPAITVN